MADTSTFKALLAVLVDSADPHDHAAFSHWYEEVQIPGFLRIPGTRRVIRYRNVPLHALPAVPAAQHYLVLYELAFSSAAGLPEFAERQHQYTLEKKIGRNSPGGSALRIDTAAGAYYEEIGARAGPADFVPDSLVLIYADPADGTQEAAFLQWHAGAHVQDAVRIPGIKTAMAYRITALNKERMPTRWVVTNRYLTVCGLNTKSDTALNAAVDTLRSAVQSSRLAGAPAMQAYARVNEPRVGRA